jgi:multidrug efflux pump subunit AcrA (membrane-fusion protein)
VRRIIIASCVSLCGLATALGAAWAPQRAAPPTPARVTPPPPPAGPGSQDGEAEPAADGPHGLQGLVVPAQQVTVRARVDGTVAAVAGRPGELVAAGALLVALDDGAVKLEAERQAAQLAATLHHAEAARAEVELLELKARQLRSLRDQRAASVSELAQLECQLRAAAARVAALREERREREVGLRDLARRAAAHRVEAPIAGEVAAVARVPGEYVRAGEPLATVRSTRRYVRLNLPASLAVGLPRLQFELDGNGGATPLARVEEPAAGATSVALSLPDGIQFPAGLAVTVTVRVEVP